MPTAEERREVAARLREHQHGDVRYPSMIASWLRLKESLCAEGSNPQEDHTMMFGRLADLIEPEPERTCHKELMVWFFPATGLTTEREVEYFGCSKCGEWLSDTDCYGLDDGPFYCSNCGFKVDPSFVTDEITGEVIYRDGVKVVEQ